MNAVFGMFVCFLGEDGGFTQPTHLVISFFKKVVWKQIFFSINMVAIIFRYPTAVSSPSQVMAQMAATLAQTEGASGIILEELLKVELEARGEHPGGFDGGWIQGVGWVG